MKIVLSIGRESTKTAKGKHRTNKSKMHFEKYTNIFNWIDNKSIIDLAVQINC